MQNSEIRSPLKVEFDDAITYYLLLCQS